MLHHHNSCISTARRGQAENQGSVGIGCCYHIFVQKLDSQPHLYDNGLQDMSQELIHVSALGEHFFSHIFNLIFIIEYCFIKGLTVSHLELDNSRQLASGEYLI